MSQYNSLKATIDANVKQNGVQAITGQILNSVLNAMVNTLGAGYQFAGVATTATSPGSPDAKVFYIANGKGTYTNFGGLQVTEDDVVVLYWDSAWHKVSTGIASQAKLSELEIELGLTPVKKFEGIQPLNSYKCDFISGHDYKVVNLGDIGVNVSTRNTPSGSVLDNLGFVPGHSERVFTATSDAAYLRLGVSESAGTISLSIQDVTSPSAYMKKVLEEVSLVSNKIGNGDTLSFEPVASTSVQCKFIKDHTYQVEHVNSAPNKDVVLSTRQTPTGDTVDLIGGVGGGGIKIFKATSSADYLRFGPSVPTGSLIKVTDISSLEYGNGIINSLMPYIKDTPFYFTGAGTIEYQFIKNRVYLLKNSSASSIALSTRKTSSGVTIDGVWTIAPGTTKFIKTTDDASYLRCSGFGFGTIHDFADNNGLRKDVDLLTADSLIYESGAIDLNGRFLENTKRIRTKNNIYGNKIIVSPDGLRIFRIVYYDLSTDFFDSVVSVNERVALVGKNNCYARIVYCDNLDDEQDINYKDYLPFGSNSVLQEQLSNLGKTITPSIAPFVNFDMSDDELLDMSEELEGMNFDEVDTLNCRTYMDQIYAKFDALCDSYPKYITKIDAAQFVGKTYPTYANLNGQASGSYSATPSYKMYMYKLSTFDENANSGTNAKRKVFIAAGLHGWEHASQWNTFIIASKLCKLASENYYALRSCYDFYLVPCVNGYGAYHYTRQNANGVDINRNFPNPNWVKSGVPWDYGYTGESAGSEFETQVIMALVDAINPDIAIDHHSYGSADYNFYIDTNNVETFKISHNVLTKWTHKCVTEYPQYYGTKFGFRSNISNTIGGVDTIFTLNRWLYWYKKSKISATWEICHCIAYLNNVLDSATASATQMGEDIVKLNEYMTRLLLMAYLPMIG